MHPKKLWWACALIAISFAACIIVWLSIVRRDLSAWGEPSTVERPVDWTVSSLAVPQSAEQTPNPVPVTADVIAEARAQFAKRCAMCHANDGSGRTPIGQNLNPQAADMRLPATQQKTDGELYYAIHNGIRWTGMPAWAGTVNDMDSWKLVHFVRHLPTLTPEELQEMQRFNPRSRLKPIDLPVERQER